MQTANKLSNKAKITIIEVSTNAPVKKLNINNAVIMRQKAKPMVAANFLGAKSVILGFKDRAFVILVAINFNKLNFPGVNALMAKSKIKNKNAQ